MKYIIFIFLFVYALCTTKQEAPTKVADIYQGLKSKIYKCILESNTISKELKGTELKIALEGRLDTTTAPDLESVIKDSVSGVTDLILDFEKLDYISSAGLRVLLSAQKIMNRQGSMKVVHVNETVNEVFEVTGFSDILTIE